jgi:hypothetical protein
MISSKLTNNINFLRNKKILFLKKIIFCRYKKKENKKIISIAKKKNGLYEES